MEKLDILFAGLFITFNILTLAYLIYSTLTLHNEDIADVAKCIFSGTLVTGFFVFMVALAITFLLKWNLPYTCLSIIALATTTAAMLSTMSRRADRILYARGW